MQTTKDGTHSHGLHTAIVGIRSLSMSLVTQTSPHSKRCRLSLQLHIMIHRTLLCILKTALQIHAKEIQQGQLKLLPMVLVFQAPQSLLVPMPSHPNSGHQSKRVHPKQTKLYCHVNSGLLAVRGKLPYSGGKTSTNTESDLMSSWLLSTGMLVMYIGRRIDIM